MFSETTRMQLTPWTRPNISGYTFYPVGFTMQDGNWQAIDNIHHTGGPNDEMAFDYVEDFRTAPIIREDSWIGDEMAGFDFTAPFTVTSQSILTLSTDLIFSNTLRLEEQSKMVVEAGNAVAVASGGTLDLTESTQLTVEGTLALEGAFTATYTPFPPVFRLGSGGEISIDNFVTLKGSTDTPTRFDTVATAGGILRVTPGNELVLRNADGNPDVGPSLAPHIVIGPGIEWIVEKGALLAIKDDVQLSIQGTLSVENCDDLTLDPEATIVLDGGTSTCTEGGLALVEVTVTPVNPPVVIPPEGGSFDYDLQVVNHSTVVQTVDIWVRIAGPNNVNLTQGPSGKTLNVGEVFSQTMNQNVPDSAPSGSYTLTGYVGDFPAPVTDTDSFTFEKQDLAPKQGGRRVTNWDSNFAQAFAEGVAEDAHEATSLPERFGLETAYPNPFNPVAVVPFALPEAAQVRISVYDVRGRRVAVLASGVYAAGRHRVLFDGSGWSSGVYLVRLEMVTNGGEVHQFTQLLTLVK